MRKLLPGLFFLFSFSFSSAQDIEWLRTQIGDSADGNFSGAYTIDPVDNIYCSGVFHSTPLGTPDSAEKGILKYSPDGDLLNFQKLPFRVIEMKCNTKGDLFILSTLFKSKVLYDGQWYENQDTAESFYLIKLDSSLQPVYVNLISDKTILYHGYFSAYLVLLASGDPVVGIIHTHPIYFNSLNQTFPGPQAGWKELVLRIEDKPGTNIRWVKELTPLNSQAFFFKLAVKQNDEIICAVDGKGFTYDQVHTPGNSHSLHTLIISPTDGHLITRNSLPIENFQLSSVCFRENGEMVVSGNVLNTGPFSPDGQSIYHTSGAHCIAFCLDPTQGLKWLIEEDSVGKSSFGSMIHWEYRNGFYYAEVYFLGNWLSIEGYKMEGDPPITGMLDMFVLRIDTLGNVIWVLPVRNAGAGSSAMSREKKRVDSEGGIYVWFEYRDTLKIADTVVVDPAHTVHTSNTFLLKLGDYYIHRGEVSPGPYCAGDTFKIPFTIKGDFNPKNEFIAELSDEDGNFNGKERELGRLTGNQSDTVRGVLPMFSVSSSPHYRIRLRSTLPPAQSFYRKDTLRLLVYSRDSANAGNDTLLCYGQSVQLKTTGGSRWQWSPGSLLNDSNLYKPIARPLIDTEFRIIISDSSGCGDTDTDYVWVQVRPPLLVDTLLVKDTACIGEIISLNAYAKGGDSLHYRFSWWSKGNQLSDSQAMVMKVLSDTLVYVKVEDGCSISDSLDRSIKTRAPLLLTITEDSVCFRDSLRFSAQSSGGLPGSHVVYWFEGASLKDSGMTYRSFSDSILPVYALLKDGCTELPANDSTSAIPYPKATWQTDKLTGCIPYLFEGEILSLNKMVYQAAWAMNDTLVFGPEPKLLLTKPGNYSWYVVLNPTGPCTDTLFSDTMLQLESAPIAKFVTEPNFIDIENSFVQTENRSSREAVSFEWQIDGALSSTQRHPGFLFDDTGTYTIKLSAFSSLGCYSEFEKTIRVYDAYTIAIPNAFTPNQDWHNPVFAPVVSGVNWYTLKIYNRWGEMLLNSSNGYWDGTYQNVPVMSGAYMYRIDVENVKGDRYFYYGTVYLIH